MCVCVCRCGGVGGGRGGVCGMPELTDTGPLDVALSTILILLFYRLHQECNLPTLSTVMHFTTIFITDAWRLPGVILPGFLFITFLALAAFLVYKAVYNRYFHPLSRYPGPFWGSVTDLYKFYAINSIPTEGLKLHQEHGFYSNRVDLEKLG